MSLSYEVKSVFAVPNHVELPGGFGKERYRLEMGIDCLDKNEVFADIYRL